MLITQSLDSETVVIEVITKHYTIINRGSGSCTWFTILPLTISCIICMYVQLYITKSCFTKNHTMLIVLLEWLCIHACGIKFIALCIFMYIYDRACKNRTCGHTKFGGMLQGNYGNNWTAQKLPILATSGNFWQLLATKSRLPKTAKITIL